MPKTPSLCWVCLVVLGAAAPAGGEDPRQKAQTHIPPGRSISPNWLRKDDHGFRWDIGGDGRVVDGSNDAYDGGMRLQVNGTYYPTLSTARIAQDDSEVELGPWRSGEVDIHRRVFVHRKAGYCRWMDIFHNTGGSPVSLSVVYHTNTGAAAQGLRSVSGAAHVGGDDWAAVTGPTDAGNTSPAIVHVFATKGCKLKPAFQCSLNSDDVYYRTAVEVPAGKTVALCCFQAQRRPFAEAVKFLDQFDPRRELRLVPPVLRRRLLNMRGAVLAAGGVELNRSEDADVVVLRNGDELLGRITNPQFVLRTEFGELKLPAERTVALAALPGRNHHVLIILADGQTVAGELTSGPIAFRMAGGTELKVPPDRLAQAAYRLSPRKPGQLEAPPAMVILRCGVRLAFDDADKTFQFLTTHGSVTLAPADLLSIELDTPAGGLHRAIFRNGSTLAGLMPAGRIQLNPRLQVPLALPRQRVRRIVFANEPAPAKALVRLTLRNEDVLYGHFTGKGWEVRTEFGPVGVTPAAVAEAAFTKASLGQVKLVLRDGTKIGGRLAGDYVGFQLRPGPELKIHVGQIHSVAGPHAAPEATGPPAPPTTTPSSAPTFRIIDR